MPRPFQGVLVCRERIGKGHWYLDRNLLSGMHSWCWNRVKSNIESSLGYCLVTPVQSKLIHGGDYLTGRRIHPSYLLQLGAVAYNMQTRPNLLFF